MKRSNKSLAALVIVIVSGCNRQQIADLVLNVGFDPAWRGTALHNPTKSRRAAKSNRDAALDQLLASASELQDLRLADVDPAAANDMIRALLDQIRVSGAQLARGEGITETERRQLLHVEFNALQTAAGLVPAQFVAERNAFQKLHFAGQSPSTDTGEDSAVRILEHYLAAEKLSPRTRFALHLQALAYPKCTLNTELYVSFVERLANENQLQVALQVANEGVNLCARSPELQKLKQQRDRLIAEQPTTPGLPFRLTAKTIDGHNFDVASHRGKVIVVTFWATWCPKCCEELDVLRELHAAYLREGVEFVGVSLDDNQKDFSHFVHANRITWPQILVAKKGETRWNNSLARSYKITAIPFTIVVDKQGLIAASDLLGTMKIESAILEELSK